MHGREGLHLHPRGAGGAGGRFEAQAAAIGLPWGVFFIGWIAAGMLTPSGTDNTPIRTPGPLDAEHVLGTSTRELVEV